MGVNSEDRGQNMMLPAKITKGLWQTDLLLISVATFLFGYILGKFSYKLRQSVHNPRGH